MTDAQRHHPVIGNRRSTIMRIHAQRTWQVGHINDAAGLPQSTVMKDAMAIRANIRLRRLRSRFFGADLFQDPAWDMLLDLAAAELEGCRVSVSSLCIASEVPATTALRWINRLADAGLIERLPDRRDARRTFIALSPHGAAAMRTYLAAAVDLAPPFVQPSMMKVRP